MATPRHWVRFAVLASLVATPLSTVLATPLYTSGHADIGVGYHDGALEPHWHTHAGAVISGTVTTVDGEYAPNELIASGTASLPANSFQAGLLGVPVGTIVGVMGSDTNQPKIGWGAEELVPEEWTGPITITFNPGASTFPAGGQFALATAGTAWFSSFNAAATQANNTYSLTAGQHEHFDWFFTTAGTYDLNFTWSGLRAGETTPLSTSATFTVQAVPEPSTVAMLAMAGGTAAVAVIRRTRRTGTPRSA
jgi:surface-anchored protein